MTTDGDGGRRKALSLSDNGGDSDEFGRRGRRRHHGRTLNQDQDGRQASPGEGRDRASVTRYDGTRNTAHDCSEGKNTTFNKELT